MHLKEINSQIHKEIVKNIKMLYLIAFFTLFLIYVWRYKISKVFHIINSITVDYRNKNSLIIEEFDKYLKIPYGGKYIYIPKRNNLNQDDCTFTYYKDDKKYTLEHPENIPFFISADDLETKNVTRYDMTLDSLKTFEGDEILNCD